MKFQLACACFLVSASAVAQWDLTPTPVIVPSSMTWGPFDQPRTLNVPPNSSIRVVARVGGARFMAVAPNGDILVSQPWDGKITLVRRQAGGDPIISDFVTGLNLPHDMVFHSIAGTTYLYVAESNRVSRYIYTTGATTVQGRQIVVDNLPDASLPELGGSYGHALKNIALDSNNKLYISIASASNAWVGDATSDPVRCAVYRYNADGTGRELWARGLRNAEGLAFYPGSTDLWVTVNNRDNVKYPYNDSTGLFGQEVPDYIDNHPPDLFTRVAQGMNYGWPYVNQSPSSLNRLSFPPLDPDYDNNRLWSAFSETTFRRPSKGIQSHSAALGVIFCQGTAVPAAWRAGSAIALHGSWNRQAKAGYKVIYYPWHAETRMPLSEADLVTGWMDPGTQDQWGRPVDVVVDTDGSFLISDDHSGTIYDLTYTPPVVNDGLVLGNLESNPGLANVERARMLDWVQWPSFQRQSVGGGLLAHYDVLGETAAASLNTSRMVRFPGTASTQAVSVSGVGQGLTFTAPASPALRTLRVFLGARGGAGKLQLKLSDSSQVIEVSAKTLPVNFDGVATISYRSTLYGQKLSVIWTNRGATGSVYLQGAALLPGQR